jgi:hypothetical protein
MGAFEARKDRWGLIADLFYADLSQGRATPLGLLFSRARIATEAKALSGYAAYRILEDARISVDLMAGRRANSGRVRAFLCFNLSALSVSTRSAAGFICARHRSESTISTAMPTASRSGLVLVGSSHAARRSLIS